MATFHNEAELGAISDFVLMPGDPLRATYIAETYLTDVVCYNQVRGMSGYTGYYKGRKISVQGSGMGNPSMGIYAHELYNNYGVEKIIRIGTAGALHEDMDVGEMVIAMGCCSNSNFVDQYHLPGSFSAIADYGLLEATVQQTKKAQVPVHVGNIFSSDVFYEDQQGEKGIWNKMGVLAQEMETYALYCTAARAGKKALSIVTAGSSIHHDRVLTNGEREKNLNSMIEIALEVAVHEGIA